MPISTPEQRQKICSYCGTPAAPLATKCENCGSALPVAMPLPVARLMEAQGKWRLRQAGFVALGISAGFGVLSVIGGWVILLMILWMIFAAPAMLMISAWTNAYRKDGSLIGNSLIAIGVWVLCLIAMLISASIMTAIS